ARHRRPRLGHTAGPEAGTGRAAGTRHIARAATMKFIFEVRMKPGYTVEQYARAWVEASRIIQQAPGARGTYLHRKIGGPDTLLAIATWESKAHRDAKDDSRSETVRRI